jgi:hypothetical protein
MSRFFPAAFVLPLLLALASLAADETPPVEGSAELSESKLKLTNVVAYPTKYSDEPAIAVLVSERLFDVKAIKAELDRNGGSDEDLSLRQPHIKVVFDEAGKIVSYSGRSSSFSTSGSNSAMSGELKREGDRVVGSAKLVAKTDDKFRCGFDFKFNTGLLGTSAEAAPKAAPLEKLGVAGKFVGNGKEAKLAFVSAYPREAFADKPSLTIVMTEKDHSKDKKPDFKAGFGDYGNALIISCHEDGSIFGCEVSHSAHSKRGFSSVGSIDFAEFQIAGGQVQGKLRTDGEQEFFGDKWNVDLVVAAPYKAQAPATSSSQPPAKPTPNTTTTKPAPTKPEQPKPEPTKPAVAGLKAKELALPKDATDVVYQTLVEHINCKSPTDYKTLAGQYAKLLAEQGWKADGGDLVGVSAILKRTRGDATLTIFVKPDGKGSTVTIFTEGLDWAE